MENLSQTPNTSTVGHSEALRLAQERNQPLYDRLDNRAPNKLQDAIREHVARAQGKTALDDTLVVKNQDNTTPEQP